MTGRRPPAPAGTELAPGYVVVGHLSRGDRLDVYDAWSEERQTRCVLKTLRPDRAAETRANRMLRREGLLLQRFTHPHLVRAYEIACASEDGRPVVVLETLAGETLSHLIGRLDEGRRRLPLPDVAMLGLQLASVLGYLHRQGWLHLDMKPSNIVAEGGKAKLLDLSIARRPGRARAGTGTFEYLSPEQASGGVLTTAADVWGLGAVLYSAVAGEPPYGFLDDDSSTGRDEDDEDTDDDGTDDDLTTELTSSTEGGTGVEDAYPQLEGDPPRLRRRRRVPDELADVIDACLIREPADRPSLEEVARALDEWLSSSVGQRYRP